jgi:hypothetical protein
LAAVTSDETIWIQSCRGGEPPSCTIKWDPLEFYAPVADVRVTAIDLVTCAAYAEMMMKLVGLGMPPQQVSAFTTDLLSDSKRRMFGTATTIKLLPAGSSKRREAIVLLKRGNMEGAVSPAEARDMALAWLEAAEASESDALVSQAVEQAFPDLAPAEELFAALRKLRGAGDDR